MLTVTGNIVANNAHPDRVTGRIAIGGRTANPIFLSYTGFGPNAYRMGQLEKGDYATLIGRLVTLPERERPDGTRERNTILRVESAVSHGADGARGGSGKGKSLHTLFGRIGQTPQITQSIQSGDRAFSAANFGVAENVTYVDRHTGDVVERTHWHNIVAYGPPNKNPAANLATGDVVLVKGRIETDQYTSLSEVRVSTLRTVADDLIHNGRNFHFAEICGKVEEATPPAKGDSPAHITVRIERPEGAGVSVPVTIHEPGTAMAAPGRYLHLTGHITTDLNADGDPQISLRAHSRDLTMLDTEARPGGSGAGYSAVHAVGALAEKPVARLTVSAGQTIAIAETTLLSAERDGASSELPVSIWRNAAEIASEYADKGTRIYGSGYLMEVGEESGTERNVAAINYIRMLGS